MRLIPEIKGDLVGRLVPEPLPAVSTSSQDSELDVTLDEATTSKQEKSTVDPASQDSAHGTKHIFFFITQFQWSWDIV